MHAPVSHPGPETVSDKRRERLLYRLLYGRAADRGAKAKARVALAIAAFAAVYAVIAARLVMHAVAPDVHVARRSTAQDAVATARPDILDRNGEILATDVKAPSLFAEPRKLIDVDEAVELLTAVLPDQFAEPRKLIDVDEAVELLTAVLPDLDAGEVRERLASKRGFVWLKREIPTKQQ